MEVIYLRSTLKDFEWFENYYNNIFTQGSNKAKAQFYYTEKLLSNNPYIGQTIDSSKFRKIPIQKTPFSFIYTLDEELDFRVSENFPFGKKRK